MVYTVQEFRGSKDLPQTHLTLLQEFLAQLQYGCHSTASSSHLSTKRLEEEKEDEEGMGKKFLKLKKENFLKSTE